MEFVLPHFSHSCLKPYHHDMKVLFQMALSNQIRFFLSEHKSTIAFFEMQIFYIKMFLSLTH